MKNEWVKILWKFKIQTDRNLVHNISDITVIEKTKVWFTDVVRLKKNNWKIYKILGLSDQS